MGNAMNPPRSFAPIIAAVLLLLPVLYVGSYLALVVPGGQVVFTVSPAKMKTLRGNFVHYRTCSKLSERVFWPLEQIDRRVRPEAWEFRLPSSEYGELRDKP